MSIPKTNKQWNVTGTSSFNDLKFSEQPIEEPGENECLVKIQGASLNYRDLIIPLGKYPFGNAPNVIPGSDGAGTVVKVGSKVARFKEGDKVVTLFNNRHIGGSLDPMTAATGLGGAIDGTFRTYANFNERGLVHMPSNLSFTEASTLSCAGLTAWNALYGEEGRHKLKAGDWVLTQGTGGVSIFAAQFAKAAGAKVVGTTGSPHKADILKQIGVDHIINYKETPEWGQAAKDLTPGKRGFDHIVEVAGPASMKQSLNAIAMDGMITIIGFLAGGGKGEKPPGFIDLLTHTCSARGILVGNRVQMEEMCRAVEANPKTLKPIVDPQVFPLEKLKDAYEYMWAQKHTSKVCLEIS